LMDRLLEINATVEQLIDELKLPPYGLDVSLEVFDPQESKWTIRMKKHFVTLTLEEINRRRQTKENLSEALKDLFLEKFQWLTWETI
jgi:hypothetical protein